LLTHAAHQLPAMAAGDDTFEDIRTRYAKAMSGLAARGHGRVTAPRAGIGIAYRYWTPTRDLIKEFQTLGWIEAGIPAPASQATVDKHRSRRYPLTAEGVRVAGQATTRRALADELSDALLANHIYLRSLLDTLTQAPIFCPETSEGQIVRHPSRRYWADHVARALATASSHVRDADDYDAQLADAYRKRFGARRREGLRPSPKEIAELFNDTFARFALEARGLRFGGTTLDQLTGWGMELRLLDQSRYVPGRDGGNLIWLTSDLRTEADGTPRARRRPYTDHYQEVAQALIDVYFEERGRASEADAGEDPKTSGVYQAIHVVRAGAAARTATARELGQRALEELAAGDLDLGVRVRLLPARIETPPRSERIERRGASRAVHLTMTRLGGTSPQADKENQP
jgi:hypothetical protein